MTGSDHKHHAKPHPKKGQQPAAHHAHHTEPHSLHPEPRLRERPKKAARGVAFASSLRQGLSLVMDSARTGQHWAWQQAGSLRRGLVAFLRRRWVQRLFFGASIAAVLVVLGAVGLWWRLAQGPIEVDMATPWLKSAIERNFGGDHVVDVGGTQIERDEKGRPTVRLRDIVVRDADGVVVASAPKAEVGMSGAGLLSGQLRAESLNLVGAKLAVRIEHNGEVTVFAGADKRPIVATSPAAQAGNPPVRAIVPDGALRSGMQEVAGVLAWIDAVGATGLDGHDLAELGLKNGQLTVDDQRNGKQWTFDHINASLRRPEQGGVIFQLASDDKTRPWLISAAMRPLSDGLRAIGLEARQVSMRDILLALRVKDGGLTADLPLSASIRADVAADGTPQRVQGEVVAGAGTITDYDGPDIIRIGIDRADFRFNWNVNRRMLIVPFQVQAGGNQFTLRAALRAPGDDSGIWRFGVTRGDAVIDPVILAPVEGGDKEGLALNRVDVRGHFDTKKQRIDLVQGDFSRSDTRPSHNVGVAVTGSFDFSKPDPHLAFGVAGTRMPMSVMKRLWPVNVAHHVRQWVEKHVGAGTVERVVVAGNAPLSTFQAGGPPTPDDGLSVDIETTGTTLRPIPDLPPIDDADLSVRVTGRTATIRLGRGVVNVARGRSLNIADGVFSVPDTHPKQAPSQADFRIDGSVPAAAMLLANPVLTRNVGIKLDPDTSRGTVAANVTLKLPLARTLPKESVNYAVTAVLSSFSADKTLMGEKLESASLNVTASNGGRYRIKGDVKINGLPAAIDVNKKPGDAAPDLRLVAKLDEAARRKLGIDFGDTVKGTIPVKLAGKLKDGDKADQYDLDADLTRAKIDNLLPGWEKAPGQPAQITAKMIKGAEATRFEKLAIRGSGVAVEGEVELDKAGDLAVVDFPVFSLSEGDKASLKAARGSDGVLRVTMRGDVYDGRSFVKTSLLGGSEAQPKDKQSDIDLDIKVDTVLGHNGETLRGLDLKLARRGGTIRNFVLRAKIGRDASLLGDLRLRARDNHRVIYVESGDAGALFRFVDMYARVRGGSMWVAIDPPRADLSPQMGILFIRDFAVRGEPGLDRIVAGAPNESRDGVPFSEMHAEFTRFPGKMAVRNGVVRGPLVGATISGQINYTRNDVHLRGTFVPFYGLNNMFGQIPIVGLVLGAGANEGLVGITYEAVGPISSPQILVNPVSAIAPGLLRKFIPTPGAFDPEFIPPSR
jgi:hypothetical protein